MLERFQEYIVFAAVLVLAIAATWILRGCQKEREFTARIEASPKVEHTVTTHTPQPSSGGLIIIPKSNPKPAPSIIETPNTSLKTLAEQNRSLRMERDSLQEIVSHFPVDTSVTNEALGTFSFQIHIEPQGLIIAWQHKPPEKEIIEKTVERLLPVEHTPWYRNLADIGLVATVAYFALKRN